MENENAVWQILCEQIISESETLNEFGVTTNEHKQSSQNVKDLLKIWVDGERDANNFIQAGEKLRVEAEESEEKLRLEERKLELEERKMILEETRLSQEQEIAEKDLEMRKIENKHNKTKMYIELGTTFVGLVLGYCWVHETLKVNLESIITDKDAVNVATKIFGQFFRKH